MRSWSRAIRSRAALVRAARARGDLRLFLHSFCFALSLRALQRLPLPRLEALLEPSAAPARARPADRERIAASVLAMLEAGRPLVRSGCLTRGLTLYYFLRRAGEDVALCFGMGRADGGDGFDGHCWVTLDGEPYLERRDPRPLYVEMYSFGRRRAQEGSGAPAPCRTAP